MRTNPRKRSTRGSVIVESALAFIVFATLLLGAFDFGQFLFVHQALTERARYAARWGAINNPSDTTSTMNMVLYSSSTAPSGQSGYFGLTSCTTNGSTQTGGVCVNYYDSGTDNARVVVDIVNYQYTVLSPYIGGTYNGPSIEVTVPVGQLN